MKESVESLGRIRAQGIALLLITFLVGVLTGLAGERIRSARQTPDLPTPGMGMMRPFMEGGLPPMFRELNLTPEQRAQIVAILERSRPRTEAVLQETLPRLRAVTDSVRVEVLAVLTPEQLAVWDSMMASMRMMRGRMRRGGMPGRGMDRGGPPPPEPWRIEP